MKFDDVNLNDDKAAPKLDLDFGLGDSKADQKSSGFSFGGGWGGGWGSNNGNSSWGFGGAGDAPAEPKEPPKDETPVESGWGAFGSTTTSKKSKKKGGAFDFGFNDDALAGDGGGETVDLGSPAAEEKKDEGAEDPWNSFATVGKKGKKGKKGAFEAEPVIEVPPPPPVAPIEEKPAEDDPWSSFSTAKKGKKGKKGAVAEPEPAVVIVPESEPVAAVEPDNGGGDDMWGGFGMSAKDKKKAKKAGKGGFATEEPAVVVVPEPEPEHAPADPEPAPADDLWGGFGTSAKDKKKAKKAGKTSAFEPEPVVVVPEPAAPESQSAATDDFGGWGAASSKKDKKSKKSTFGSWAETAEDPIIEVPPPPPAVPEPEPEPEPVAESNDWSFGWGGASSKKGAKAKKGKTEPEPIAPPPPPSPPKDDWLTPAAVDEPKADDDPWSASTWSTGKKAKAGSKKDKAKGITEVSAEPSPGASMLEPESVQEKSAEDDPYSSWTTGKKDKKKVGKKGALVEDAPPPAPTPPEQAMVEPALVDIGEPPADDPWSFTATSKSKKDKKGAKSSLSRGNSAFEVPTVDDNKLSKTKSKDSKGSKESPDDILEIVDEAPPLPEEPKPKSPKEEKSTKSAGWGLFGGSKKDTKSSKDKEKEARDKERKEKEAADEAQRQADEALFAAALGEDPNEIMEIIDEAPPKKSSSKDKDSKKSKGSDKLSKTESKSSKKSEPKEDPIVTIVDEPAFDPIAEINTDEAEPKKADGWGFWGASLKSTKKATPAKEIGRDPAANQAASLTEQPKMPEFTLDNQELTSAAAPPKSASKLKSSTKSSSIQDRIKALQVEPEIPAKESKKSKFKEPSPPPPPEPESIVEVAPPVDEKKSSKKSSATKSSSKKPKDLSPTPLADPTPVSRQPPTPVPGGFPVVDDYFNSPVDEMAATTKKSSSKDKKASSKPAKPSKSSKADVIIDAPAADGFDDLLGDAPTKLPTPPPDDSSKADSKPSKKERPKVVRDQGTSSWGFWGATPAKSDPKKARKSSRDEASSPVKERPSGLSRSKSARKTSERDPLEKGSRSSGSEKNAEDKPKSRPNTSRGMSFFGMGAPPPPSRSKSMRQPESRPKSSRRQSTAIDDSGMMSPPPDDRDKDMPAKAAKMMGFSLGRSKSTREKKPTQRKVPDPYAIDSDDMIVVDDVNPPESDRRERKSRKSKRDSVYMSGGLGDADDAVMVDAPRDEAKVTSGPDDFATVDRPSPLKRSNTAIKKAGLMVGILGAFAARPAPERRQSRAYESEHDRKRGSVYDEEGSKRLRRDDRKVGRSRKVSDADGFADAAPMTDAEEAAAREARRAERRERKAREAAEEEARQSRRAEREEARRAKAREEEEAKAAERRARREARRAEEDRLAQEEEAKAAERRERRRAERAAAGEEPSSRPKTDRRRSHMDYPVEDEEARRQRREERRMRRSAADTPMEKERPKSSRRRSDFPAPVEGYFDKRNGEQAPYENGASRTPADGPYVKAGGDKTASWVNTINDDPPPPPPVEGTIIDAPVHYAADDAPDALNGETTARELRHKRRKDRDTDGYGADDPDRRYRRRDSKRDGEGSSGGSAGDRRSRGGPVNSLGYDTMGAKTWDGRPAMAPKRGSWFKKIAGL